MVGVVLRLLKSIGDPSQNQVHNADCLIFTHDDGSNHSPSNDRFFGSAAQVFIAQNLKVTHGIFSWSYFGSYIKKFRDVQLVATNIISLPNLLYALRNVCDSDLNLIKSQSCSTGEYLLNLCVYGFVARQISLQPVKLVLLTFEGHFWEQLVLYVIRSHLGKSCSVIALNRPGFFNGKTIMRFFDKSWPDEFWLLCPDSGSIADLSKSFPESKFKTFRKSANGGGQPDSYINSFGQFSRSKKGRNKLEPRAVLFAPSGLIAETFQLLLLSWKMRKNNHKTIFRLHPRLESLELMVWLLSRSMSEPIVLSRSSVAIEDLQGVDLVVVKSSSVRLSMIGDGLEQVVVLERGEISCPLGVFAMSSYVINDADLQINPFSPLVETNGGNAVEYLGQFPTEELVDFVRGH